MLLHLNENPEQYTTLQKPYRYTVYILLQQSMIIAIFHFIFISLYEGSGS